jgi:deoxycytidylate deaminase
MNHINTAHQSALKSSLKKRYGCIILHRNKIVGIGYNYDKLINTKRRQCLL